MIIYFNYIKLNRSITKTLFILLVIQISARAQSNSPDKGPRINQLSPQPYELVKHGNFDVSLFTGQLGLKIPIYNYTDDEFNLPIFLGYNSSGFIPNKRESFVGLDWFINAGGVITRKVNEVPDERQGNPAVANDQLHGTYYGAKNSSILKNTNLNSIINLSQTNVNAYGYWQIDNCEVQPDEFTFSAPGLSGRFFIDNTGTVRVISNEPIKVDLSNFSLQTNKILTNPVSSTEIKITNALGFQYYFGGSVQCLEISYPVKNYELGGGAVDTDSYYTVNAWHLKKMISPSGRQITFNYVNFIAGVAPTQLQDPYHYLYNVNREKFQKLQTANAQDWNSSSSQGEVTFAELTKTVYLQSIEVERETISFEYMEREKKFYEDESSPLNQKGLQLQRIKVTSTGQALPFKEFNFHYQNKGATSSRLFLTALHEKGLPPYAFTYHETGQFPPPKTRNIDHWGFWNGGFDLGTSLIPNIILDENTCDITYNGAIRSPNSLVTQNGLLKTIQYPSGGISEFTYQPHSYNQRLERRSVNGFIPALYNQSGFAGGARIFQIKNSDKGKVQSTKEYRYVTSSPSSSQSSGILLNWPRYMIFYKMSDGSKLVEFKSSTYNSNYYPGENFIQYSEVMEMTVPSNGYTHYKFTDYVSNGDANDINSIVTIQSAYDNITDKESHTSRVGLKLTDYSFERGSPKQISTFGERTNGTFFKIKEELTEYTSRNDFSNYYSGAVLLTGFKAQSFKIYYKPFLPVSKTIVSYADEGQSSASLIVNYSYDSYNNIIVQGSKGSDNKLNEIRYRYPSDYLSAVDNEVIQDQTQYSTMPVDVKALIDLYKNNIIAKPIETVTVLDDKVISASLTEYKNFSDTPYSSSVYPAKLFAIRNINDALPFLTSTIDKSHTPWTFSKDSRYGAAESTYIYSASGNLQQTINKGSVTSYIWGYKNQFLLTEAENITYQQIVAILGETTLTQLNNELFSDDQTRLIFQQLRQNPNALQAGIVSYTHTIGKGMTSVTDVNGQTIFYEYDSQNRLRYVKDHENRILKNFEYRFRK